MCETAAVGEYRKEKPACRSQKQVKRHVYCKVNSQWAKQPQINRPTEQRNFSMEMCTFIPKNSTQKFGAWHSGRNSACMPCNPMDRHNQQVTLEKLKSETVYGKLICMKAATAHYSIPWTHRIRQILVNICSAVILVVPTCTHSI